MALPLTWPSGAANPFATDAELGSFAMRNADHDLRRSGQNRLESVHARPAERRLRRGPAPQINDAPPRVERGAERALLRCPLRGRELLTREWRLDHVLERASHL